MNSIRICATLLILFLIAQPVWAMEKKDVKKNYNFAASLMLYKAILDDSPNQVKKAISDDDSLKHMSDHMNQNPLEFALEHKKALAVQQLLILNPLYYCRYGYVQHALNHGDIKSIYFLFTDGKIDIDSDDIANVIVRGIYAIQENDKKSKLLHIALNALELIKESIKRYPYPYHVNRMWQPALLADQINDSTDGVRLLISNGGNPNCSCKILTTIYTTPLFEALKTKNPNAVRFLLESGAHRATKCYDKGPSPLAYATRHNKNGDMNAIIDLLQRCTEPSVK